MSERIQLALGWCNVWYAIIKKISNYRPVHTVCIHAHAHIHAGLMHAHTSLLYLNRIPVEYYWMKSNIVRGYGGKNKKKRARLKAGRNENELLFSCLLMCHWCIMGNCACTVGQQKHGECKLHPSQSITVCKKCPLVRKTICNAIICEWKYLWRSSDFIKTRENKCNTYTALSPILFVTNVLLM